METAKEWQSEKSIAMVALASRYKRFCVHARTHNTINVKRCKSQHKSCWINGIVCDCYGTNSSIWINKIRYLFINKFKLKWNCYGVQWFIESTLISEACILYQAVQKTFHSCSASLFVCVRCIHAVARLFFHFVSQSLFSLPICYSFNHTRNRVTQPRKRNNNGKKKTNRQQ